MPSTKQFSLQPPQRPSVRSVVYMSILLARIALTAKGLNVFNVACTPLAYWLDVIGRQLHSGSFTPQTSVAVMVTKVFPFSGSIASPRLRFAGSAAIVICRHLIGVGLLVAVLVVGICLRPATIALCFFILIILLPAAFAFSLFFRVGQHPRAPMFSMAHLAFPVGEPFTRATSGTWQTVSFGHNKKSPLPECLTRGLYDTILSGRLTRPRVLKLLAQLSGLLFLVL